MWIFLVSDAFSFAGLLLAEGILRAGQPAWIQPGEPALGLRVHGGAHFPPRLTSFTNVIAWAAAVAGGAGRRRRSSR